LIYKILAYQFGGNVRRSATARTSPS
jgi:hypothetical protein